MSFKKEVIDKLGSIESKQIEHTVQLAVNNKILEDHTRRSTNLEARVLPIEQHVMFINKSMKVGMGLITVFATILAILRHLSK